MSREEMLLLLDDLDIELTTANGVWVDLDPPEDGLEIVKEELTDSQLQTLIQQIHTKIKRPWRPVGTL